MVFFNGGARLTCEGSVSLEDIRQLEERGCEILTCGTCLDFFGIKEKLAVGGVTNLYAICRVFPRPRGRRIPVMQVSHRPPGDLRASSRARTVLSSRGGHIKCPPARAELRAGRCAQVPGAMGWLERKEGECGDISQLRGDIAREAAVRSRCGGHRDDGTREFEPRYG